MLQTATFPSWKTTSPEYGEPLSEEDSRLLVGIDSEVLQNSGARRVDHFTAKDLTGAYGPDLSGIAFPYYRPGTRDVLEYVVRLDNPPLTDIDKNGRPKTSRRYLWPHGKPNRFYFPVGTKAEWLLDTTIPVIFVEGVKKALALWGLAFYKLGDAAEKPHFLVIGLNGVYGWRAKTGRELTENGG